MLLTLKLYLVLNNEVFALVINFLGEFRGNGVMSGLVLEHETFITLEALEDRRLFDVPVADKSPLFLGGLVVNLLGVGCFPSRVPVVGELF